MGSPRKRSSSQPREPRRATVWAAMALGSVVLSTGCQVEYAGMTLPSGKYFHDDVQYFPPGPDFPWANTQAATQRARMEAMGMEVPPVGQNGPLPITPAAGAIAPVQNQMGRPTDVNSSPLAVEPPVGGAVPQPGGVPAPGGAGEATTPPGTGDLGPR